jgi:hypothetical protein
MEAHMLDKTADPPGTEVFETPDLPQLPGVREPLLSSEQWHVLGVTWPSQFWSTPASVGYFLLGYRSAKAHDANHPRAEWYNKQEINPIARQRMGIGFKSCCEHADVYKTRFRVAKDNSDQWEYLRDGKWKVIPPDIIKDEDTPDREPVLFINKHDGVELCFFVPRGGI